MVSARHNPWFHRTASQLAGIECRTTASSLHHRPLLAGKRSPRTPVRDPLLSFVPRWKMSAAGMSSRYLTPVSVRQHYKVELLVIGRLRRPSFDPKPPSS